MNNESKKIIDYKNPNNFSLIRNISSEIKYIKRPIVTIERFVRDSLPTTINITNQLNSDEYLSDS